MPNSNWIEISASDEVGPLSLYRYGPQVDANGYYVDTKKLPMNLATLLDGVTSQPKGIEKTAHLDGHICKAQALKRVLINIKEVHY